MQDFLRRCREWQKIHPQWTLICDLPGGTDHLYEQWEDLPQKAKMHWIGKYREGARAMFEEFGTKRCKVLKMVLDDNLNLCEAWPDGNAMTVYNMGISAI